jgi:IgGFc binding protein
LSRNADYGEFFLNGLVWYPDDEFTYTTAPTTSCAVVPFVQSFSVADESVTNISIPDNAMMNDNNIIDADMAIAVTADGPISVYAVEYYPALTAAFTVYPASMLGTNYCVLARSSSMPITNDYISGNSEFAIVATADNTMIWITPSTNADLSGVSTNLTLQAGQSYEAQSATFSNDVTGTVITSDKPIAVFAGATDAYVPSSATGDDNPLMQEQFPVNEWGTNILALSFAGRTGGDSYRVLPAQNGTILYTNGVLVTNGALVATNLQAGAPLDLIIDGGVQFTANKPVQVAHFGNGSTFDHLDGDPCEILLLSTNLYMQTNVVVTLGVNAGDIDENFLNVIVPQAARTNTLLDGTTISATNFIAITNSGYYGARLAITNVYAAHRVTSMLPISVEAYGWGFDDAYGYVSGIAK